MAQALAQDFALILMDVRMPVLDGLGATSRLRAAGFWRPIVALTASAAADQRAACLAAGLQRPPDRPIAPAVLVSKVADVCRRLTTDDAPLERVRERAAQAGEEAAAAALRSFAARAMPAWRETPYWTSPTAVENAGVAHHLGQAADALGDAAAHRDAQDLLAQLGHARRAGWCRR